MLGPHSTANDWELRMSMRSFRMHYRFPLQIWIIGRLPAWVSPEAVNYLSWPDPYRRSKDANLLHKALRLAMEPGLSDPFILCSDDHFLLKPSLPEDFKLWRGDELPITPIEGMTRWQLRLVNTGVQLRLAGFPAFFFDTHVPYPLHKAWIRETLRFDFSKKPGMSLFSTILNCSREQALPMKGNQVRGWLGQADYTPEVISRRLTTRRFACFTDHSLEDTYLTSQVEHLFAAPAPWELDRET